MHQTSIGEHTPPARGDAPTARILELFARFEVAPVPLSEMQAARDYVAGLVKLPIASAAAMRRVHRWSGLGLLKAEEDGLAGVIGIVPLSATGLEAIYNDEFNAIDPAEGHVSAINAPPSGIFGWGIAATSHQATKRMIAAADVVTRELLPHLAWFGRTVTDDGERLIMRRLGWKPLPGSTAGIVWKPSLLEQGVLA